MKKEEMRMKNEKMPIEANKGRNMKNSLKRSRAMWN